MRWMWIVFVTPNKLGRYWAVVAGRWLCVVYFARRWSDVFCSRVKSTWWPLVSLLIFSLPIVRTSHHVRLMTHSIKLFDHIQIHTTAHNCCYIPLKFKKKWNYSYLPHYLALWILSQLIIPVHPQNLLSLMLRGAQQSSSLSWQRSPPLQPKSML